MKAGGMKSGGCWPIAIGALVSLAIAGGSLWYQSVKADEAEHKNDIRDAKMERRGKLMQLKEYNQALGAMNRGRMLAEQTILKEQRKKDAEEKFYGKPV